MSTEHNKTIIRRNYEELWNGRRFELADEFYASDSVSGGAGSERAPGPEGFKQLMKRMIAGFPDLHFSILNMIGEGDSVATLWEVSGTYRGGTPGFPDSAIGKRTTQRGVTVNRLRDGKIIEGFNSMDQLEMLKNLGIL